MASIIRPKQRKFIELIVFSGFTKEEAFASVSGLAVTDDNMSDIKKKAEALFYRPALNKYYHALMEEVRDTANKKAAWTKEVAETKLMRLIERAEEEIYGNGSTAGGRITMSRLNAILLAAKELNTMNGLNTTSNLNIDGQVVQIIGEDSLED